MPSAVVREPTGPESTTIPSSVMERYFARPAHRPTIIFDVNMRLEGEVDAVRLQRAWHQTIRSQPRLYWVLSRPDRYRWWKSVDFDSTKFSVASLADFDISLMSQRVDVAEGIGASLSIVSAPQSPLQNSLRFLFHHSSVDGVGAARVIYQTLGRYNETYTDVDSDSQNKRIQKVPVATETTSPLPASGSRTLPDPRHFWATVRGHNAQLSKQSHVLFPANGAQAKSLLATSTQKTSGTEMETIDGHWFAHFDQTKSRRIRETLRRIRVPLNDFGVALALHSIARQIRPSSRRYLSIMNPVQMRNWAQRRATENHVGFAFVRRRHDELQSLAETVDDVHHQLAYVREHRIGGELASGMQWVEKVPGGLELVERSGFFVPTASVTCLSSLKFGRRTGMVLQTANEERTHLIGTARVKDLRILAPLQNHAQLAITIWDSGSGISLSLRHRVPGCPETLARSIAEHMITFASEFIEPTRSRS